MAGPVEREIRAAGNAVKGVGWKAKPIRFVGAEGNIIAPDASLWHAANGLHFANRVRALRWFADSVRQVADKMSLVPVKGAPPVWRPATTVQKQAALT